MASNFNQNLNGLNPLAYVGVNSYNPPALTLRTFSPTSSDSQNVYLGQLWMNTLTQQVYMLTSLAIGVAHWVLVTGPNGTVTSLTGNSGGAVPPAAGNINVVGDGTTISIVGNPATHTLTVSTMGGAGATNFVTDNGTAVESAGNITFNAVAQAGSSVTFSGAGSTVRLNVTDASRNTIIGILGGNSSLTGTDNTSLGRGSLHDVTTGSFNTSVGLAAGAGITTGASNTLLGYEAGNDYIAAESFNVVIGAANQGVVGEIGVVRIGAVQATISNNDNTFVGYNSGNSTYTLVSALGNTGVGSFTLHGLTTGAGNTAIGSLNLTNITASSGNTAIGLNSMQDLTTSAGFNTAVGGFSLATSTTGAYNTSVGYAAGENLLTGSNNVLVGWSAGTALNGTETDNTVMGYGNLAISGEVGVVRIGSYGGTPNTYNTFVGTMCGNTTLTFASAGRNTGLGGSNLNALTTGSANTAVGATALPVLTTGSRNTACGNIALNRLVGGTDNTAIGNGALNVQTGGNFNTAVGSVACGALTTGGSNTSLGYDSLDSITIGTNNIALGYSAGSSYTSSESSNITIGNLGTVAESNVIRLGTQGSGTGQQNTCYVAGIAGVSVSNLNYVTINTSTNQLGSTSSAPSSSFFLGVGNNTGIIGSSIGWLAPYAASLDATQSSAQFSVPLAGTISKLYVNVGTSTTSNSATVTINKNGSNTTVVATVPNSTTGVFTDLTHSFSVVAGDTIQFESSSAAGGTAIGTISCLFTT